MYNNHCKCSQKGNTSSPPPPIHYPRRHGFTTFGTFLYIHAAFAINIHVWSCVFLNKTLSRFIIRVSLRLDPLAINITLWYNTTIIVWQNEANYDLGMVAQIVVAQATMKYTLNIEMYFIPFNMCLTVEYSWLTASGSLLTLTCIQLVWPLTFEWFGFWCWEASVYLFTASGCPVL